MNSISSARKQSSRLFDIDQIQPLAVYVPTGSTVHCIRGRVWLTQEGLLDDIVLAAGEKFVARQKGLILMNAIDGAALVYLSAGTQGRADEAVIFTPDFLEAARTRAAELRHEELARLAGVAWDFVMRLVKRIKAGWKTARPAFREMSPENQGKFQCRFTI